MCFGRGVSTEAKMAACSERQNVKFLTLHKWKEGLSVTQIHQTLVSDGIKDTPSLHIVRRWVAEFKHGNESLSHRHHTGRQVTSVTRANIEQVRLLIEEDPYLSIKRVSTVLSISVGSAHTILHDHLNLKKVCARWIPHLLSDEQKRHRVASAQEMLDIFEGADRGRLTDIVTGDEKWFNFFMMPNKHQNRHWMPHNARRHTILRPGFSTQKRMFTIFFDSSSAVVVDMLQKGKHINSRYYRHKILPQVINHMKKNKPASLRTSRLYLLHDNASSHKTKEVNDYLATQKIKVLPHPPYSPDLAPCDFWLFPLLTQCMAERKFSRCQDLAKEVNSQLRRVPRSEYAECFKKLIQRLRQCIEVGGEYFEGLQ
jgi:histone-lysine N-methyltransferase SETMAR